jgi:hypothetical protein
VRLSDGATVAELPWGILMGPIAVARGGELVAGSESLKVTTVVIDSGRVFAALPFQQPPAYTEDGFQSGGRPVRFSTDGSRLVSAGVFDLIRVDLTPERRPPAEIARIVAERTRLRVDRGQLAPLRAEAAR